MDAKSQGAVVQLVRMPACHAGGRGFESLPHRRKPHKNVGVQQLVRLFSFVLPIVASMTSLTRKLV